MATRGLGKLKADGQDAKVRDIASRGGKNSPTKFTVGDPRARAAGQKGGQARAQAQDVKSGALGRRGAAARWGKKQDKTVDEAA